MCLLFMESFVAPEMVSQDSSHTHPRVQCSCLEIGIQGLTDSSVGPLGFFCARRLEGG